MKKLIFILLILFLNNICYGNVRNIQDNYQLIYNIVDSSGNPVASETVTLKIKKISNGYWYDFNDSTFKASGWTNKTTNLSEDGTDAYYYTFNPPASETGAEQYMMLVDNASGTYGDHQSLTVTYQNIGTSIGDPWSTELPGSYNGVQAGNILDLIKKYTNGIKDNDIYNGIEVLIRSNR